MRKLALVVATIPLADCLGSPMPPASREGFKNLVVPKALSFDPPLPAIRLKLPR